ncbi:hypothetical protein DFP74_5499 [Nocardiopsis sp. Huas11]|uniref:hypothetical protein n=1 Tax=Nocardiopsis sp. Huas11 TaxID=2183912 RepID=UPI000EAF5B45|nr:hypothetical protein [Nocardiopsis sp. Huas11]RKS09755.1 hypothetical protein DFP74_5499 [Nocardiopsis sp. Huas11]
MTHPSRPTFSPDLPPGTAERLRRHADRLVPAAKGPPRRRAWRRAAAATAGGCAGAALLALLWQPAGLLLGVLLCLMTTAFLLGLVSRKGSPTDDWGDLFMHATWALPASIGGVVGLSLLLDQVVGPLHALVPGDPALAALYLAAGASGAGAIMRPGMIPRLAAEHYDQYVLPEDFGRPHSYVTRQEEPEAHLFAQLQQATDRVEEGMRILGDSFDPGHTLPLLREEEWTLSQELLRLRTLRRELAQRRREAVSTQVTKALAPQEEAVARAHDALTERVEVLAGYGERVHEAVTAHREWEQCQAIADRAGDYADLALTSTRDSLPTEDLDDGLLSVRAARTVREELVRKAIDAGTSLSRTLHHRDPPDHGRA